MIASVTGRVAAVGTESAVVEVGGLGLELLCAPRTLARLRVGESARLSSSLVVREEALTLYGFADEDERSVFELLQTAGGVGPKLALAVLAVHAPAAVRAAVAGEDLGALTLVPGIGRKGAQRIVLELKDRIGAGPVRGSIVTGPAAPVWREQLRAGLAGLGWSPREVDEALVAVGPQAEAAIVEGVDPDIAGLLRSCLRSLART
ncbi:MAG TPA: Holliday junction branch migration protein RuvA [Mycobacteriales bacterium]|nr:Holliday junction branch migration protein RuvA [Mycobacteriales bacterium]